MSEQRVYNSHQGTKPSNPKDAVGVNKSPMMSYVPQSVIAELGIAMMEGGHKYGRHNYRAVGVRASIYADATARHLAAWWEGEDFDPDSAALLSHITKAIASLTVLRDSMIQGNFQDDRPPKSSMDWQALHAETKALNEQYPNPVSSITEVNMTWVRAAEDGLPERQDWPAEVDPPVDEQRPSDDKLRDAFLQQHSAWRRRA